MQRPLPLLSHARHSLLTLGVLEFGFAVLAVSGPGFLGYGAGPRTFEGACWRQGP